MIPKLRFLKYQIVFAKFLVYFSNYTIADINLINFYLTSSLKHIILNSCISYSPVSSVGRA